MKSAIQKTLLAISALIALVWGKAMCAEPQKIQTYTVESEYQGGKQEIRVLLPDSYNSAKGYRVLYILPVEKGFNDLNGYALGLLQGMDAHNRYDIIMVQMGFEMEPWFGDHASDKKVRQASYMKEFVVPFIEDRYSTLRKPEGRLLLGFSKSGWGAFSLILTYPDFFGYAAAWDAPFFFPGFQFNMAKIYGTQAQLDAYRPDLLVTRQRASFQEKTRLVLAGEKLWGSQRIPTPSGGSHTREMHQLLGREGVRHVYINNLPVPHRWDERWMAPTLEVLIRLAQDDGAVRPEPGRASDHGTPAGLEKSPGK